MGTTTKYALAFVLAMSGCVLNPEFDAAGAGAASGSESSSTEASSATGASTGADVEPGTQLWSYTKDGGRGDWDRMLGLTTIPGGDVVAVGQMRDGTTPGAVVRLDPDGNERWFRQRPAADPATGSVETWGAAHRGDGTIAVAGTDWGEGAAQLFVTVYDAQGELLWSVEEPGEGFALALDQEDGFWVGGRVASEQSAGLWHFDASGTLIAQYDASTGTTPPSSVAWGLAHDGSGGLTAVGSIQSGSEPKQAWIRRIRANDGGVAWSATFDAVETVEHAAYGTAFGSDGDVLFGGMYDDGSVPRGWFERRGPGGEPVSLELVESAAGGNVHGLAFGPSGEFAVSGWSFIGDGASAVVSKYGPGGTLLWSRAESGDAPMREDNGWDVEIRDDGVVVVAGSLQNAATSNDMWVAAYAP